MLNPLHVVPKRDWVMVLNEPRKMEFAFGIIPELTGVERVTESVGRIVSVGPGDVAGQLGIEVGQRVCYRAFVKYVHAFDSEEFWPAPDRGERQMKRYSLIAIDDLMGVVPEGMEVGVFSGRPMVPGKEQEA